MSDSTANDKPASPKTSRLMTFRPPQPSAGLIKALAPINRWLTLGGVPGLRALPILRKMPGISGLMNVTRIEFPTRDEKRLRAAASNQNATFIVPNHPEFFTDWMLDKEIMSRVAPMAACWATHSIVNGMGRLPQKFWLKTNLIAQIPGKGGGQGKAYSIEQTMVGNAVLLHPEGSVGWHGDLIGPLFPGAIDMARETVERLTEPSCAKGESHEADGTTKGNHDKDRRPVLVAPVIWKLTFNKNVETALHAELSTIETALEMPVSPKTMGLADRLYRLHDAVLARHEISHDIHPTDAPYFDRQEKLVELLAAKLHQQLTNVDPEPPAASDIPKLLRACDRWLRGADKTTPTAIEITSCLKDLRLILRFRREMYADTQLTQEHIAENLKRLRSDYCDQTARDKRHQFVPRPVGPRTAHIRVPEPMDIAVLMAEMTSAQMVTELHRRMQDTLDNLTSELASKNKFIRYANPFVALK